MSFILQIDPDYRYQNQHTDVDVDVSCLDAEGARDESGGSACCEHTWMEGKASLALVLDEHHDDDDPNDDKRPYNIWNGNSTADDRRIMAMEAVLATSRLQKSDHSPTTHSSTHSLYLHVSTTTDLRNGPPRQAWEE